MIINNENIKIIILDAVKSDLKTINDIYNYYVLNSTCTYQTEEETLENRMEWFENHNSDYPVIVAKIESEIAGWASISRFHPRKAYTPTVENSIYIKNEHRNKGIGKILLSEIIDRTKRLGYHSIIAKISSDQEASIKLHSKFGFIKVAHLKEVGFKFNNWLDILYMQLIFQKKKED
jgi:L-amino acid N-acyltransferase